MSYWRPPKPPLDPFVIMLACRIWFIAFIGGYVVTPIAILVGVALGLFLKSLFGI